MIRPMMMIQGTHYSSNPQKIQPVDPDRQDDRHGEKKRRTWQGREVAEAEDDLPLQPTIPQTPPTSRARKASAGVYADRVLLEKAEALFSQLTTIEEKAAQLCFLLTEAIYDTALQHRVELLIQTWQIGGILFHKGDYRRQAYLIERFQEITKTPLLFANDYLHGLSFYLQGDAFPKNKSSEQYFADMGKAVIMQNRRLGVQIQFDRERGTESSLMNEAQAKAFCKGIRSAQGIVAKEKALFQQGKHSNSAKPSMISLNQGEVGSLISDYQVQETIGFKTLIFFDGTHLEKSTLEEELLSAFQHLYDVFLLPSTLMAEAIRAIARLVHSGKIREEVLDRHVLKTLIIKSLFFK